MIPSDSMLDLLAATADPTCASPDALDRLTLSERIWAEAAEALGDAVWVAEQGDTQAPLRFIYVSRTLIDWLHPAREALAGGTVSAPDAAAASHAAEPDSAALPGLAGQFEFAVPGGSRRRLRERRLRLDAAPFAGDFVKRSSGLRIGAVVEDLTAVRDAETVLQEAVATQNELRLKAERQSAGKDEFISVVSHDLRSPLNAIRGWAHVLKLSSGLTPGQDRALDAIDRNITAQARMVDDLLDSQRILRGKLVLAFGQPALAELIDEAVETIRAAAESKRIVIDVRHDPSIGAVEADVDRLRQALSNLLSNSLKFTADEGRISVESSRVDATPNAARKLRVTVSDTGIGLTPEQLPHAFDPVMRADQPSGRRQGGLNLPLSLARQLVEMHGGTIAALSDGVDAGLTMVIELPATQRERMPQ